MTDLINLNNFLNHAIGFEDVFRRFHRLPTINAGFPHYNIKKAGEDKYTLEMAVAGYKKSDIMLPLLMVCCLLKELLQKIKKSLFIRVLLNEQLKDSYN